MKTERCQVIELKMSIVRLLAIILTYYGLKYFSYELLIFILNVVFCGYVYLEDQLRCVIQDQKWNEEKKLLAEAIERFGTEGLELLDLIKKDEETEEFKFRKCVWINQLIEVLWFSHFQGMTKKLVKQILKEVNIYLSKRFKKEVIKLTEFAIGDEPVKILNVDSKIENLDIIIDIKGRK